MAPDWDSIRAAVKSLLYHEEHGHRLGLTIAKENCESYGGKLTAENRKEGGARLGLFSHRRERESDENRSDRR
jgi:K+-sensing histidine kinase KdpD